MSVTRVKQSAVIPLKSDSFWNTIAKLDFKWWNIVESSEFVAGGVNQVNSVIRLTFKDKAAWLINVTGISNDKKSLEFAVIESTPSAAHSSQVHEIIVAPVTFTDEALFTWTVDYSSDVTAEVVQDSKFKRIEAFRHLVTHSIHGTHGVPNGARAAIAAHLAAEEAKHPHLNHVVTKLGLSDHVHAMSPSAAALKGAAQAHAQ